MLTRSFIQGCFGLLFSLFTLPGFATQVFEKTLPNGLKVLVKPDHRSPVAVAQIWYKVGSSYESNGVTGISHALEHMMFRGTEQYPGDAFSRLIESMGGQYNAFTSYDYTVYYEIIAADKLSEVFKLEADRMQHLTIDPNDFVQEKQVIKEERRLRTDDNPQNLTHERFMAAAFVTSPYRHPVIGWMDDIEHLTVQDLRQWYHQWYAPNNAVLVVVGDVQPDAIFNLAEHSFGGIKPVALPPAKPSASVEAVGPRNVIVRVPAKLPWLITGYNAPAVTSAKETWHPYALDVLAVALGTGRSSRLQNNIVRKGIAASIHVDYDLFSRLDDLFVISTTPAASHSVTDVQKAIQAQILKLQTEPMGADELNKVKRQLEAYDIYDQDEIENQASRLGSPVAVGLPWQLSENYIRNIHAVTAKQVQEVAKEYLTEDRLTIGILQPINTK